MEHVFTDSNFETEVVKSTIPVFVDFWAPWCGPCQMMGPVVEGLANELDAAKIKIGKLNVDENEDKAAEYRVLSIPTFVVFKDGKIVDQLVGGMQKEKLIEMINKHI
jgi:thioredoxin 1